jgi:outer membrane protein OmpU
MDHTRGPIFQRFKTMTKKNLLLGTTAFMTAALIGTAVHAGTVGSKDSMKVSLSGEFLFYVGMADQDFSEGRGRGYSFNVDETEVHIEASTTAENGLTYGVNIELNAGAANGTAADEAYAFVGSEAWGRLEMGDNDDATDRMYVESDDALVGRAGPDGDAGDFFNFGSGGGIEATGNTITGDASKLTYFTPRIGGFQVGASLTPDTGVESGTGGLTDTDNDGDFDNVIGLGVNWDGKFENVGLSLSLTGEFGDSEDATGAEDGDLETISVGGMVTFENFAFGVGHVDFAEQGLSQAEQTAGVDAGSYWTLGGSYSDGPWGVSANWFESSKGNTTGVSDTDIEIASFDASYKVAPGWTLAAALHMIDASNINATAVPVNNDGTVFLISNAFKF